MVKLKRVVLILVCCLLILSSCQFSGQQNQNDVTTEDTGEGNATGNEADQDSVDQDEIDAEEVEEPAPDLIALVPTCEEGSWISPVDGARLICVPEGSFQMGGLDTDEDAEEDELPLHEQDVYEFWIYETEVTNAMFQRFVEATGYTTTAEINGYSSSYMDSGWAAVDGADWQHPLGPDSDISGMEDHPVVNVSLDDAESYCLWSNNGYLPSEAQWEKAARGTELNLYPWGNDPVTTDLANYAESSEMGTMNVFDLDLGMSPYGLLHMSGNVAEWISMVYKADYYTTGVSFIGTETENQVRGGSWQSVENELRVSDRQPISMEIKSADSVGFRCVVSSMSDNPVYATSLSLTETSDDEAEADASESSSSSCDMVIPASFRAEVIVEGQLDKLQQYAYTDQDESASQDQTLQGFWESEEFKLGLWLPGEGNIVMVKVTPCGMIYLYALQSNGGVANYDEWMSFEFLDNAVVTTAQDKSTFMFFGGEAAAEENSDGSVTVHIPCAACENAASEAAAAAEEVTIDGYGVESYELSTLADGSLELIFVIELGSYPQAFDAWKETLLASGRSLLGMSSTVNKEGDVVVNAYFTVNLPAGSTVTRVNDILTINIKP